MVQYNKRLLIPITKIIDVNDDSVDDSESKSTITSNTGSHKDDETNYDVVQNGSDKLCAEPKSNVIIKKCRRRLPTLAQTCDRHGVSDRAAAAIASAVLQDFGVICNDDLSNVIDQNKVRRERLKKRNELQDLNSVHYLHGLYFDGRKDKTLQNVKEGQKYYRRVVSEEHLSLVQEPGSIYVGHVSPTAGSALQIKKYSRIHCWQ